MRVSLAAALLLLIVMSCTQRSGHHFEDSAFQQIANDQDHAYRDSLLLYFHSDKADYRASAALAFASIEDSSACSSLGSLLLEDTDTIVRRNAAFALGQTGGYASVNALLAALSDKSSFVLKEVLQALGKTVRKNDKDVLSGYVAHNDLTRAGLAWAIYRLGSRGLAGPKEIKIESELIKPVYSDDTRKGAANFFARSSLTDKFTSGCLLTAALSDPDAEVRMAATSGLRKLKTDSAFDALTGILKREKDYRVRVNAIRALAVFPIEKSKPLLLKALTDSNVNAGIAASETIVAVANTLWPELGDFVHQPVNWRIQANLYKAILKANASPATVSEIKSIYATSKNNYQQAWLLGALAKSPEEYPFIGDALLNSKIPVIRSSAADALVSMNYDKKFDSKLAVKFAELYRAAVLNGDPAVVGIVCAALSDTTLGYRSKVKDFSFLTEARDKMTLPRDIESYQPLQDAIDYFMGKKKSPKLTNTFNHPIVWTDVKNAGKTPVVTVTTSKGVIEMKLLPDEAPGSVANFIQLVRQHYFDGKYFHRTVPNFVIQTGCNRGDGYGSEAYSIRSEFSGRPYLEGAVGMASAGKDTEGTQWFITHSSTPHLDGRYTIFAQVTRGMDVVHKIEVGDQILTVNLQ